MDKLKRQWYALYTKPRWEKKVAHELDRKQVENYCPLYKVTRQWSDRKKIILEPLFTSYVFVYISETEFFNVRTVSGVLNLVFWLKKPAIIRDEEINAIKKCLNEYENVQVEKSYVNINDQIRIISGPLIERIGNVIEIKDKTVKIWLPSLGYNISADIQKTNIQLISSSNSIRNSAVGT